VADLNGHCDLSPLSATVGAILRESIFAPAAAATARMPLCPSTKTSRASAAAEARAAYMAGAGAVKDQLEEIDHNSSGARETTRTQLSAYPEALPEVLSPCRSRRPDRGLNRRPDPRQRDGSLAFSQIGSAMVVRQQFFGMIYVG
jgi:hypothetical protein